MLTELVNRKILFETQNNKLIEIKKETSNNESEEINRLKKELNEERSKNKNLEEQINIEKNKNKIMEEKLTNLRNELNSMKMLKVKIEKINKNDSKETLVETIIEKEKENKDLKLKLSRFPFELNEGEKLLSVIFTSVDQKIHHSIICKNTDKFHIIESQLLESYPEYQEYENFYTFNGKKINKNKTLEENGIGNSNIIVLNFIE